MDRKRLVVLLLAVALAVMLFSTVAALDAQTPSAAVTRVGEVENLRQTNSQTYQLSDGSYECVVYAENKFYYDSGNVLQPIDNAIIPKTGSTEK